MTHLQVVPRSVIAEKMAELGPLHGEFPVRVGQNDVRHSLATQTAAHWSTGLYGARAARSTRLVCVDRRIPLSSRLIHPLSHRKVPDTGRVQSWLGPLPIDEEIEPLLLLYLNLNQLDMLYMNNSNQTRKLYHQWNNLQLDMDK